MQSGLLTRSKIVSILRHRDCGRTSKSVANGSDSAKQIEFSRLHRFLHRQDNTQKTRGDQTSDLPLSRMSERDLIVHDAEFLIDGMLFRRSALRARLLARPG
jgi:hypothetical protein